MTVTISGATEADARFVAQNLRAADVAEMAFCGLDTAATELAIIEAVGIGHVRCARAHDVPMMIYGIGPDGYVWALGTDLIAANSREFLRLSRSEIDSLRAAAGTSLWTVAWRHNPLHLRWLSWCGFVDHGDHEPDRPLMVRPDHV